MQDIMVDTRFIDKLKDTFLSLMENKDMLAIEEVWLFGSVARGDCNANSDIDIMVITSNNPRDTSLMIEELDLRDDCYFPKVDIVVRSPKGISSNDYYFNEIVRKERIILWKKGDDDYEF